MLWATESTSHIWKGNVKEHLEVASLPERKNVGDYVGGYIFSLLERTET